MKKLLLLPVIIACLLPAFAQNKARVDKYAAFGDEWLADRLQMHWNTHATKTFVRGEVYDHCGGDSAAVPTVQLNGSRGHVSVYQRPKLEDLPARSEDSRGMYLYNNNLKAYEWAALSQTGGIIHSINKEICDIALDAAKLWQRDGNEQYARMAQRVLDVYVRGIGASEMPYDLNHGHQQTLVGLQTFEVIQEKEVTVVTELYRILRPRLSAEECAAYDVALKHWADIIEANGVPHNNWDLMQAMFIFNIGQCLQPNSAYADGKGQEYYFDIVETGKSIRQWSLKALTDYGYDKENGIWCECPGYCQVVLGDLAEFVRLYREQLGRDLLEQLPVIALAARNNVEYLFPDSMLIGFGDTHPGPLKMDIYKKLNIDYASLHPSRTFAAPKTSWLVQRNGMERMNSMAFAINGADGNHMHANGPSLELYGRGLRLAPDAGIGYSLYSGLDYLEYYSQFPAHNTVCVDGVSSHPVMKSNHPFRIISNTEQQLRGESDESVSVQYSEVYMLEPETQSDQQRLVAMVTTGNDSGYFVDVFRSRRQDGNDKTHDYFYHNLGQQMQMMFAQNNESVATQPTEELAFAGAHLYAYSYMWDKHKASTDQDLKMTYTVRPDESYMSPKAKQLWNEGNVSMTQWMRGEAERDVYRCLSPSTEGLTRVSDMPYNMKEQPTLTFVARQYGEAWTRPFVSVFEPSSQTRPGTIKSVSYPAVQVLDKNTTSAVAVLVEHNDGKRHLIISTDNADAKVRVLGKTYRGRFNAIALH